MNCNSVKFLSLKIDGNVKNNRFIIPYNDQQPTLLNLTAMILLLLFNHQTIKRKSR